jgi:hypothetical protein
MVGKIGYYTQDDGEDVTHYYMGAEPPQKQYVLREGDHWELLPDPWSITDMNLVGSRSINPLEHVCYSRGRSPRHRAEPRQRISGCPGPRFSCCTRRR